MGIIYSFFLVAQLSFSSPVNYKYSLAGNFGEPRPNHFHGGIDVRTGQVEGKPVFSVADGYVCRVTVGMYGFGNAVYVRHPNGITSVYCHLKKFTPQLAAIVRKWQYQHRNHIADVYLKPTDYPVAERQLIAVSGNTGASKAPHLHLEFHDTRTWSFIDPLCNLKDNITDTTKPIAHSFMAYPVIGQGVFCGSSNKQSYGFASASLSRQFTAWGKVGFGIWANDYMDESFGILGIKRCTLSVDGKVVFSSCVDSIPAKYNRMVNSWGDYEHYCRTHLWYLKSFAEPGNMLPVLHYGEGRGIVTFDKERDYHLVYHVSDIFGNYREYSFTVRGVRQSIRPVMRNRVSSHMRYDRYSVMQRPGVMLAINPGLLPDNVSLRPQRMSGLTSLSDAWTFYPQSYPLFGSAKLSLKLKGKVKDTSKLYISTNGGTGTFLGGKYEDGWVTSTIKELGARYEISYDDVPPTVSGLQCGNGVIRFAVSDNASGSAGVWGYVDGQYVVFDKTDKSNVFVCKLSDTPIKRQGKNRLLRVEATDNVGNRRVIQTTFKY
ncbi:MAG: M23 family metallopeptidase [Prevotella sp.]